MFYEVLASGANVAKPLNWEGKDTAQRQLLREATVLFISVFQEPFFSAEVQEVAEPTLSPLLPL